MADTPEAAVRIGADDTPLRQALTRLRDQMMTFGRDSSKAVEGINGPLDSLRGKFVAVTALLSGGAMFGKAIQETQRYTQDSIQLGKALGTSAAGASVWVNALQDVGATQEEFAAATRGMLERLRGNEKGLNDMGLATRDAAGNLRPMNDLVLDAIRLTNDYKAGTDRQVAANRIWGESVGAASNLLKLNTDTVRENAALMEQLGLVVSQQMVESYQANDQAMDQSALVMKALTIAVGNALLPVLTKLGEWFVSIGPAAVTVVKGAIGGLVAVFWGLKNAVTIAFEVINASVITAAEPIRALATAMYKLVQGDFKGAAAEMMNWPDRIGQAWSAAWANILKSSSDTQQKLHDLFADGAPAGAAPGGNRTAPVGTPTNKPDGDAAARVRATKSAVDQEAQEERRLAAERRALMLEQMRGAEALALAKLDTEEAAAQAAYQIGEISYGQLAALQTVYEQQRFAIAQGWLQERLRLAALDPDSSPAERARIQNEILLLEQQHLGRMIDLQVQMRGQEAPARNPVADMLGDESMWGNMFNSILNRAWSWRSAMQTIYGGLRDSFIRNLIVEPAAQYVAGLARLLLVKLGFLSAEKAAQTAATASTVATKATETVAVVGANAAQAGSGAAAAVAPTPFVGPILAIAAMAAIFAAVMGLSRKSARGGYDIPSGVDPLTQLHEEEMVLPSPLANAVRRMAGDGETGGEGGGMAFSLNATPLPGGFWVAQQSSFVRFFNDLQRNRAIRLGAA
jgi:hypothetical protein